MRAGKCRIPAVVLIAALLRGVVGLDFNEVFASNVFNDVEELLTVPWYQGLDQINTAFSSQWQVIQDGSIRSININNTFSYVWTLFRPFYERTGTGNQTIPKLDALCE